MGETLKLFRWGFPEITGWMRWQSQDKHARVEINHEAMRRCGITDGQTDITLAVVRPPTDAEVLHAAQELKEMVHPYSSSNWEHLTPAEQVVYISAARAILTRYGVPQEAAPQLARELDVAWTSNRVLHVVIALSHNAEQEPAPSPALPAHISPDPAAGSARHWHGLAQAWESAYWWAIRRARKVWQNE